MNRARIVVLTNAVGAGGVAAWLASGSDPQVTPARPAVQLQTVDVLFASNDIGLGQSVAADDVSKREKNPDRSGPDLIHASLRHSEPDRAVKTIKGRMI
jgi:Flp pilus assembly protein CpaB